MTLHVHYDHKCPSCGSEYIPYDADEPCPRCGLVEVERFDFIPLASESARFNMKKEGGYVPAFWIHTSFADQVLALVFKIMDLDEQGGGSTPFKDLCNTILDRVEWHEREYLKPHVLGIALRVKEALSEREPATASGAPTTKDRKLAAIPYPDPNDLARLLWETEMVADRYSNGDLILIRTRGGWRGFFGHFNREDLDRFEKALDQRFPSYEAMLSHVPREPNLIEATRQLLVNAWHWFPGYTPMDMLDDLDEGTCT